MATPQRRQISSILRAPGGARHGRSGAGSRRRVGLLAVALAAAFALPSMTLAATVDVAVTAATDDAEERTGGAVTTNSGDLELVDEVGQPQHVGIRFAAVAVPQGATITSATIRFTVDEATSAATTLTLQGQAADNAATFTTAALSISSRTRTAASVPWLPAAWPTVGASGADQTTPNLASLVQAIVSRPGWTSGNAMVFIVTGSGARIAEAFEGGASVAPKLHIEYETAPPTDPPTITSFTPASAAIGQTVIINGNDFNGTTAVKFNGTTASFVLVDNTKLMATIPVGATTGPVSVTNGIGTTTSAATFTVTVPTAIQVPADYSTIQAAINAASAGATIQVAPGNYAGFIVDKPLTIESHFPQTNDPATRAATVINGASSGATILVQESAGGTTLRGFTMDGGASGGASAMDGVRSLGTLYLLDNRITGFGDAVDFDPPLTNPAWCYCQRNTIEANGDDAIDFDGAGNAVIADNILRNNDDDGIETRLYDSPTALSVTIRGNTITGNGQDGIQLIDEPGVSNRTYYIDRNVIVDNSRAGIGMMDNSITTEDYRAASILDAVNLTNNTIALNNHGLSGGDNVAGVNNIFVGNTVGVKGVDGGSTLTHTLFWNNGTAVTGSNVDAASRIDANPLFTADYHLNTGSPAIDSGIASFSWNSRTVLNLGSSDYSGSAPDRGAFETQGSDTTAPTITGRTPANGATGVSTATTVTATFSEAMNAATITSSTVTLVVNATSAPVSATVTYDAGTRTATLTPSAPLAESTTYRAAVVGGSSGVKDLAGIALASTSTWTFTTEAGDTSPPQTTITSGPAALVNTTSATIAFSSNEAGSTFTCSLDGATGGACTSPVTLTSLGQGEHTFTVAATDASGNTDLTPATRTWTVDSVAPAAPAITSPAAGATLTTSAFTVTGTAEPGAQVTLRDGTTGVGSATAGGGGAWSVNLTGVANGPHSYSALATDAAGNASSPSPTVAITVSVSAPTQFTFQAEADSWVSQAAPTTNYGSATPLSIDGNANASEDALLRFDVTGISGPATNAVLRVWVTNATTNGPTVRTAANTWQEQTVTWNTRPADTGAVIANAGAIASGAYYEFNVTSAITGSGLVTFHLTPETSDGLDISSREAASNRPQLVVTGPTAPDETHPTVDSTTPADGASGVALTAPITATFSEAMAAGTLTASSFTLSSSGGPVAATVAYNAQTRVATLTPSAPLALNTAYTATLTTTVTDLAGNALLSPVSWTFTTTASDADPPDTTILTGPPAQTNQTTATFTFTSDDPTATFSCSLDGAAASPCTSPLTLTGLASGAHQLQVTAIDGSDNADPTPATRNWTITNQVTFTAQADALLNGTSTTSNFGAATTLESDGSPIRESLMRFTVAGTGGPPTRAVLRIYVTNVTNNGPAVYLTNTTWTENTVTYATRPARLGGAIVDVGAMNALGWYEFDVTSAITGDGTYSFNLASISSDALKFSSREVAAQAPELVVTS